MQFVTELYLIKSFEKLIIYITINVPLVCTYKQAAFDMPLAILLFQLITLFVNNICRYNRLLSHSISSYTLLLNYFTFTQNLGLTPSRCLISVYLNFGVFPDCYFLDNSNNVILCNYRHITIVNRYISADVKSALPV